VYRIINKKHSHSDGHVHIKFIGDLTYTKTSIRNVKGFEECYDVYSQTKKKNLINAIQIARKIHNGEMTWMQHYNQCKRKVNGRQIKKEEEEDKDMLIDELNESNRNEGRYKVIRRKRKRSVGSTSISDRVSCNKNSNSDVTLKKEECNNVRRRCSCGKSRSLNNKNVKRNCCDSSSCCVNEQVINNRNNSNTLHIGGTRDIMDIVDNFIYTKKNLQYEQFDETFNSLKQSIMSVRHNDSNFNVSKYTYNIILFYIYSLYLN
jgi:hypothetical protein